MAIDLHPATPDDIGEILRLIRELAEYERDPDAAVATPALLRDALFGPERVAHAVMADVDGTTAGFALWFYNFSTWTGRPGLYLEDLYVRPAWRGRGVGFALLHYLAGIALQRGCGRMEWSVLKWNVDAIRFYERLGATPMDEWQVYRMTGEAIRALANDARAAVPDTTR